MMRELNTVLCDNLEGLGKVQEGGDVCILLGDSHPCMAKPTQHCRAIILQLEINEFFKIN